MQTIIIYNSGMTLPLHTLDGSLHAVSTIDPALTVVIAKAFGIVRYSSQAIFAGGNEVEIEHNGTLYRLRLTSLGKLILTK